eukprot:TRINITY_DN187_c0_g1_i1.p1 TRINITY_DN187_c0_g1~~TRINITY_DN187_c0_g1_i1.p1  ORF type:complete len:278 (-),score=40.37 TRINITY_DN187_c0_g1_i1:835-1668(-)
MQTGVHSEPLSTSSTLPSSSALSFLIDICGVLKRIKRTGWVVRKIPLPESDSDHMHRAALCAMLYSQPADSQDDYSGPSARFHPEKVDVNRLVRMAVTHDLCEALAGDITPYCPAALKDSKFEREKAAMEEIKRVVGGPLGEDLIALWTEYEGQETIESIICRDIDKFEMCCQAFEYEMLHLRPRADVHPAGTGDAQRDTPNASVAPAADAAAGSHPAPTLPPVEDEPLRRFFQGCYAFYQSPLFRRLDRELRSRREAYLASRGWALTEREHPPTYA